MKLKRAVKNSKNKEIEAQNLKLKVAVEKINILKNKITTLAKKVEDTNDIKTYYHKQEVTNSQLQNPTTNSENKRYKNEISGEFIA